MIRAHCGHKNTRVTSTVARTPAPAPPRPALLVTLLFILILRGKVTASVPLRDAERATGCIFHGRVTTPDLTRSHAISLRDLARREPPRAHPRWSRRLYDPRPELVRRLRRKHAMQSSSAAAIT